jgi:hypothetical protein
MKEGQLSRREFMKMAGIGLGAMIVGKSFEDGKFDPKLINIFQDTAPRPKDYPEYYIWPENTAFTREGASRFYLALDKVGDKLKKIAPEPPTSVQGLQLFAVEAVPYFIYEDIRSSTIIERHETGAIIRRPQTEIWPQIGGEVYPSSSNFHIAGQAHCYDATNPNLTVNYRYFNPFSPWHKKAAVIATLVHELGHTQDASCDRESGDMETATQIAAVEVLAAMTRHGNKYTMLPLIGMLQEFTGSYLLLDYILNDGSDGIDLYKEEILSKAADTKFNIASFEKSMTFWKKDLRTLEYILREYGAKPYAYLVEAMSRESSVTRRLPVPNMTKTIRMDDTKYFISNLHALARDYEELLK